MHCNLRPPEPRQPFAALITPCHVWRRWTYPLPYYSVFAADTLLHTVTLTFDLEHLHRILCNVMKLCTKFERNRNLTEIEQSLAKLFIILRIFAHVISRCDLDLWPLDLELLQHFGCHAFKLCTKFEWNRLIHGCVIDDVARFRVQFWGWVRTDRAFSGVREPNFTKPGQDIGRSS